MPVADTTRFEIPNVKPSFASITRLSKPANAPVDGVIVFVLA